MMLVAIPARIGRDIVEPEVGAEINNPNAALQQAKPSFDRVALLAIPALVYMTIVFALPVGVLVIRSFTGPTGFTISAYTSFLSDTFNWQVIGNTLRVAALTAVVCLVIGYPTAVALARAKGAVQALLLLAIILPLSVGVVVKTFAWQIVLRRDGIVAAFMIASALRSPAPSPRGRGFCSWTLPTSTAR